MKFELSNNMQEAETTSNNEGYQIVFTPYRAFESARYFTGSKTWVTTLRGETIEPTHYLKLIKE